MTDGTKVSEHQIRVKQIDAYRFEVEFDKASFAPLVVDEPAPLGQDAGPNATRVLAAAIGNCLAASLRFCLAKNGAKVDQGIEARVRTEIVRTPERRLRVGKIDVTLELPPGVDVAALDACSSTFEEFCTVTASVRHGIEIAVHLEPSDAL